jgi:prepilin-type N-terminal cleavage/methylation domain-containing protein
MTCKERKNGGFTLIELIVVLGLMAFITTFSFLYLGNYSKINSLKRNGEKIVEALRATRQKSITQEKGLKWGMRFLNSTSSQSYILFGGSSFESSTNRSIYLLSNRIAFSNPYPSSSLDLIFNAVNGIPTKNQIISLFFKGAGSDAIYNVFVNSLGSVSGRLEKGLVGYWPMDEGQGDILYDASFGGNNGRTFNNPTWQSFQNCRVGNCLKFNPNFSQYVNVTSSNTLNVPQITMTAWIYLNSYSCPNDRGIILNKEGQYEWGVRCGSGNLDAAISPNWSWYGTTEIIPLNSWSFVAVSWDGNVQKYYINGRLSQSYSLPNKGNIPAGNECLRIGGRGGCGNAYSFFNGVIDDVRIYSRALSDAEILDLYNLTR